MLISIRDLSHLRMRGTPFETAALSSITLDIGPGGCIGISGRSGSGKSTLVQHLNGTLKPTAGSISVGGIDVAARSRKESLSRVGMVFQYPEQQLFEETVYREIAFGLARAGMSRDEIDIRIRETIQVAGLGEELLQMSPFRLSGGEKRRVAIAAVLAGRPEILILDEPAAGLDPRGRRDILNSIARMQRELGFTLVLVSNSLEEMVRLADRIVILKDGAVALQGSTREVIGNARALESAGMPVPVIAAFMTKLRAFLPELDDCVVTVEQAREELKRVLLRRSDGDGARC